ncbi:hypothetical protein LH29_09435 [Draconibacterium sediminis]|uniref:Uncharacterized protein n=1 Tax=Draconibacterium sediminis TaxID=1544798 RepID=A0A0D8JI74_9BACT|nr:hypothetical protein LH29_09435 [Draconibacterium sediminis]
MSARLTLLQKVISTPLMQSFVLTVAHAQKFVRLRQLLLKNSPLSIKTLKLAYAGFFYALLLAQITFKRDHIENPVDCYFYFLQICGAERSAFQLTSVLAPFIIYNIFSLGDAIACWQLALPKAELNSTFSAVG